MYYEDYFTQIYQKTNYKSYFGYYLQFLKIRLIPRIFVIGKIDVKLHFKHVFE
jgi:hypothetical protein